MDVEYFHPSRSDEGKFYSDANIIWAKRDQGSPYYRTSKFGMRAGKFPPNHPCAPFNETRGEGSQMGGSESLTKFRGRGYWASCFPEGDGICLQWWGDNIPSPTDKTAEEVIRDIEECFGWTITNKTRWVKH